MVTDVISLSAVKLEDAVNYNKLPEDKKPTPLIMEKATVVEHGMECGKSTVDIICKDAEGKEYLIFTTSSILQNLGGFIKGTDERVMREKLT